MDSPNTPRRVLVTGSTGVVGRAVCRELAARGHFLRGFARRHTQPDRRVRESHVGQLSNARDVDRAVAGVDTVVHLAAVPYEGDYHSQIVPGNLVGVYHVCEAARRHGVRRLILASSVMIAWALPWKKRIVTLEDGIAPTTHYGLSKDYAEQMGRMYAGEYGLSVLAVRIGWLPRDEPETTKFGNAPWAHSIYLSPLDCGRCFARAVEADDDRIGGYAVIYLTSRHTRNTGFDLEPAKNILGYEPRHQYPDHILLHLEEPR